MTWSRVSTPPLPAGLAAPLAHYAHAKILNDQIFVSGLLATDIRGDLIGAGDAGEQARFIFRTLGEILRAAGSDLDHVAKLNLYLLRLEDRGPVNAARRDAFGDHRPASTLVQVAGLIGEGTLLEIEAVAAVSAPRLTGDPR